MTLITASLCAICYKLAGHKDFCRIVGCNGLWGPDMTWKPTTVIIGIVGMATVVTVAAAHAQNGPTKLLVGDAKVEVIISYRGDPLPKPDRILVCAFTVSPDVVTVDESAAALLQQRRLRRRDANAGPSRDALAKQVQDAFAKTLLSELQKKEMLAKIAPANDADIPAHTLIVHGELTAINQGNETKRMMIGFGRGASDVQAHVTLSLTTDAQRVVLSEFNLKSKSGKKPGAVTTMGVGSLAVGAAAGGVSDRKASVEADASRMARAVAKQIEEAMNSQKWIAVQQPQSQSDRGSSQR